MSETVEAEWTIESGEHLLRLVLFRAGDRYAHRIECRTPSGVRLHYLESLEGVPRDWPPPPDRFEEDTAAILRAKVSEAWPASPPFQQFHDQEIDGRRAWFLVGMAGRSHWSASVTAVDRGWEFDVACRYKELPAFLGSAYLQSLGNPGFRFDADAREFHADEWIGVERSVPATAPTPASARWKYRVSLREWPRR